MNFICFNTRVSFNTWYIPLCSFCTESMCIKSLAMNLISVLNPGLSLLWFFSHTIEVMGCPLTLQLNRADFPTSTDCRAGMRRADSGAENMTQSINYILIHVSSYKQRYEYSKINVNFIKMTLKFLIQTKPFFSNIQSINKC